jgi:hypothetical protein
MLFLTLWVYHTSAKMATNFTPFQLIFGMESVLSIEFKILSLELTVKLLPNTSTKGEHLFYLARLDEKCRDATLDNEMHQISV